MVEVRRSSHNTSLPCLPPAPLTIYDVPKCQPARSRSSWSLEPGMVPPLPSPRKYQTEGRSLPVTPSAPSQAVRRLFDDAETVETEEEKVSRPKMSPDFSSKTLKPKKSLPESGLGGGGGGKFRARNNSESVKQPEAVYNELTLILERRRQNLETKPSVPDRPRNLTVDTKEVFPPYSKVNKVPRQQKERADSGENKRCESSSLTRHHHLPPPHKSFLHSFAQSGKLGNTAAPSEAAKSSFNTFKGW